MANVLRCHSIRVALAALAVASLVLASFAAACGNPSETPPGADAGVDGGVDGRTDYADVRAHEVSTKRDAAREAEPDTGPFDAGPAPLLTALSVSGPKTDAGASLGLVPPFSSDVHDYYVRCSTGTNALTVSMTASAGADSLLVQPIVSASLPEQTLSLDVYENQAIVAVATSGASTTEYWVRCLPHDFPTLQMTPHPEAGTPPPGYYLLGNLYPALTRGGGGYALVMNGDGVPVWYARAPSPLGAANVDTVVAGSVSFLPFNGEGNGSFTIRELSPLTATLMPTTDSAAEYQTNLHEMRPLSNGNFVLLGTPFAFGVDLTGLALPLPDGGAQMLGANSVIIDCSVLEFTPAGTFVSMWLASDHFDARQDSTFPAPGGRAPEGGIAIDTFHCNSIDVEPSSGNLLVSARNMDSIFYIDRSSGAVVWKMGGKTFSKDGATYVTVKDPFFRQHDARLQPGWSPTCAGGSGQVSVFDDETSTSSPARGVVYDVVVGGGGVLLDGGCGDGGALEGGIPGMAKRIWEYKGPTSSIVSGSMRISADGSRVIGWGKSGTRRVVFTEVDLQGHDLLDFGYSDDDFSYRVVKVPLTTFDLETLRRTAGFP